MNRWLVAVGLCGFALVAIFSGLDRYTEHQPNSVRLVPRLFLSDAARARAAQSLALGEYREAREAAVRSIRADPLDRRGPAFLAAANAIIGAPGQAARAFGAADKLGLREPVTQSYFFGTALEQGDAGDAARRVDTLLKAHPDFAAAQTFIAQLEKVPRGQSELLRRLQSDPRWARAYLEGYGADDSVLTARARGLSRENSAAFQCGQVMPMVRALEQRDLRSEARRLMRARCPEARSGLALVDPGFDRVGRDRAFGWRRHLGGDVRIGTSGNARQPIGLSSRASVTRLMLSQPVDLDRGEYRAFASIGGAHADRVLASLDCGEAKRPARGGGVLGRGQLLRAADCRDLVLGIWLRPGTGTVMLDNLRIESIGRQAVSRP